MATSLFDIHTYLKTGNFYSIAFDTMLNHYMTLLFRDERHKNYITRLNSFNTAQYLIVNRLKLVPLFYNHNEFV